MNLKSALLVVGGSACSFKLLNTIIRFLPTPEPARKKPWSLYLQPQMLEDLISSNSLLSHSLVAVSTGYFIHDFLDVALNQPCKQSWEVLLHHSVVISCFTLAVTSGLYVGYSVVSLLVEINSIFLHIRHLLLLSGRRNRPGTDITALQPSVAFSVTSWLNLGTLLVFRVCLTAGLSLVSIMNMVLLYRLIRADVLSSRDH